MKLIKLIAVLFFITSLLFLADKKTFAQSCGNKEECQKLIDDYQQKLVQVRQQKNTLSSQIDLMDTQISLTGVRILETENRIDQTTKDIETLGGKIEGLNTSLDYVGRILLHKIVEDYKRREVPTLTYLIDSKDASELVNRYKYAQIVQENDRRLALQVQQAKLNYEEQKDLREKKKVELDQLKTTLDQQKIDLGNQKISKEKLLRLTQNDEARYQSLLAAAKAENAAIQGIVSGAGTETLLREIKKGEAIGSYISGSSCNSNGAHLHFTVLSGGSSVDPFNYLQGIDHSDNSGGDSWHPSGSWSWPISGPISFNQGYGGDTSFIKTVHFYSFHNGIDIAGSSNTITAVADGTLYRGSYSVGCALPYAKVVHKDDGLTTLYLHSYTQ